MKIVFLDASTVGEIPEMDLFRSLGEFKSYDFTNSSEVVSRLESAEIAVTNKVVIDKKVIDHCPDLKLICVAATGTNNIDLDYASKKGIAVKNVKGYSTDSVVQHTFAMIFSLMNHIAYYDNYVKSGAYSSSVIFTCLDKPFFELSGKEFGIIGLGTIGKKVAEVARIFGARVSYFSTSGLNNDSTFKRKELNELVQESDIISIHAPLNERTNHLISMEEFSLMKSSALLINTGRGGIVDEKALVTALKNQEIAGAALDVFNSEPLPLHHILYSEPSIMNKLLLSPHIAWASQEARGRLLKGIFQNIQEYQKNKTKLL
ncbi:MAG: D-2-hydroxyacid dehydrogenase [Cytophagaceae bacterium]